MGSLKSHRKHLPARVDGQSNVSLSSISLRLKYCLRDLHMHGVSSVEFSMTKLVKRQNGENCCGVI